MDERTETEAKQPISPPERSSIDPSGDLWRSDEGGPHRWVPKAAPASIPVSNPQQTPPAEPDKRRGVSWRVALGGALILTLLALGIDGALALMTIKDRLEAVSELGEIGTLLTAGDIEGAEEMVASANNEIQSAQDAASRPGLFLASLLPEVNRETKAIAGAVDAADLSVQAADSVVQGAATLELDSEGVPTALYDEGQVKLDTVSTARDQINNAEVALTTALITLEQLDPRLDRLRAPIDAAHDRITEALARTTGARTMFDLMHPLLGGVGQRKYLLAFQAPGEARGTGGLVGIAGVLSAEDGAIELRSVRPYTEIVQGPILPVEAPGWFETSYSQQRALTQWPQASVSPNNEAVSAVYLEMYEQETGERLDGVFGMDPIALEHMMKGMEPIETSAPSLTIDATNVADTLLVDSYTGFQDRDEQNDFLKQVIRGFWEHVESGAFDLRVFSDGMGEALRTQHLKIYSRKESEQENIQALNLDGNYDVSAQMVFNINYAANKVDYFLNRDIQTDIELQADGSALVRTKVRLKNSAPGEPPSPLLGEGKPLSPGVNRMTLNMLMPPGSQVESFSVGGDVRTPFDYIDDRSPVVWDVVELGPGEGESLSLTYTIRDAIQILGENTVFDFSLFPQATINPDSFALRITPPPGNHIVEGPGEIGSDGSLEMSGTLDAPLPIRIQLSATE